jgi:hypothetical protein
MISLSGGGRYTNTECRLAVVSRGMGDLLPLYLYRYCSITNFMKEVAAHEVFSP